MASKEDDYTRYRTTVSGVDDVYTIDSLVGMSDQQKFNYSKEMTFNATGSGTISETLDPGEPFQLTSYRLHLSGIGANETIDFTLDSVLGQNYDAVIESRNTFGETSIVRVVEGVNSFVVGDSIDISCSNSNSRVWGLEVKYNINGR
jgi:hypothetical protein